MEFPPSPSPDPASTPPVGEELSGRALAAGLLAGAVLAVGNVFMGLETGLWGR